MSKTTFHSPNVLLFLFKWEMFRVACVIAVHCNDTDFCLTVVKNAQNHNLILHDNRKCNLYTYLHYRWLKQRGTKEQSCKAGGAFRVGFALRIGNMSGLIRT